MGTAQQSYPKPKNHKEVEMKTIKRFLADSEGQDFAEYALLLGAIAVVALAVIASYKNELLNAFNRAIAALQAASN
jgi:Flp pilus assembly pilin Flp